jgi:hypothetical protein
MSRRCRHISVAVRARAAVRYNPVTDGSRGTDDGPFRSPPLKWVQRGLPNSL